ncbi:MAG: LysM peptidoglycan-binding domain-containing protein [Anaerolineales bacterium]|uniref:LysM peptidoglycan-binding domain-containing protein n=1 Tax=Candidatus Villigracilis proximus TaxID=3140683 RepID=UPI003136D868|nr:LysM peptidoglycan-binding domain-containing protein [Anaerolineales bacterium]
MRNLILTCVFLLTACAPASIPNTSNNSIEPYLTVTPSLTSTPNVLVIAETPLPTATPFIYTIQSGDTFSELAEQFKISQDALRAANPDVSPNSMSVGTTLLIPDSSQPLSTASTLTPVPAPVTQTVCHPSADSGLWCFALIHNDTSDVLEYVSAQITLLDENNNALASQTAFPPLDIIPANSSLPVYVFFPNTSASANTQIQLLSAIQSNNSQRPSASLHNTIAQINWNGLSAHLSGQVILPAESTAATQVWVAAVAYDKDGQVVGLKRWEGGAIQPGGNISFSFLVSSLGPEIDSVEFVVEARP